MTQQEKMEASMSRAMDFLCDMNELLDQVPDAESFVLGVLTGTFEIILLNTEHSQFPITEAKPLSRFIENAKRIAINSINGSQWGIK